MNRNEGDPQRSMHISSAVRRLQFAPRMLAVICLLAVATVFASAQETSRPTTNAGEALAPLRRQVEQERARLASSSDEERRDAVQRLGAMARADASRVAAFALGDASPLVRATAARAVLSLPPPEAAALLLPLLRDKNEFVRRESAYALGSTRSRAAVEALTVTLARDKEAGVRGASAVALGQIGDASAVPVLAETVVRRVRASGIFNRITRRTTEENDFVRRAAAVALGQIRSRDAVPALIAALANERAGDDVRREAARALGLIGDPTAIPALRAALLGRDPFLSQIAYDILRKLDPSTAIRPA